MIWVELPPTLQRQLKTVIRDSYHDDLQAAMSAFLVLHEKYGWKEQLRQDVGVIRAAVRQRGGVTEETIDDAIRRHREQIETNRA